MKCNSNLPHGRVDGFRKYCEAQLSPDKAKQIKNSFTSPVILDLAHSVSLIYRELVATSLLQNNDTFQIYVFPAFGAHAPKGGIQQVVLYAPPQNTTPSPSIQTRSLLQIICDANTTTFYLNQDLLDEMV